MFFTDNNEFFRGHHLQQDPVYNLDSHLIYTVRPGLWLSTGIGYDGGGETAVNGVSSNNTQSNLGWGIGLGLPLSRNIGVKLYYIGSRTQTSTAQDADTFAAALSVMW